MNKFIKVNSGVWELSENGKPTERAYKNKWGGWTLAIFQERTQKWIDCRYFSTLQQIKKRKELIQGTI